MSQEGLPKKDGKRRMVLALLAAIVALGAGLRLYHLGAESLWYDEGATLYFSELVNRHLAIFDPFQNNDAPLNPALVKCWYAAVRLVNPFTVTSPWTDYLIRLLPCFWSILAIPLVFIVGRLLLEDVWAALIAAFLVAISPFQIYYAQELRPYSLVVVLSLAAVYFLMRAMAEGQRRHWAGMVAALALLVYGHYFAALTLFFFNLWFACLLLESVPAIGAWARRTGERAPFVSILPPKLWPWIVANCALLALIVPAIYCAYSFKVIMSAIKYPWPNQPTHKTPLLTFKAFFAGYGFTPWAYWALFLLAACLCLVGLAVLMRRRWRVGLLLAILTFLPIATGFLIWHDAKFPYYEHRLFIFSGVTAILLVAAGIRTLAKPAAIYAVLALYVFFTIPCLDDFYLRILHPVRNHVMGVWAKADLRSAAEYIAKNFQPGDRVITASHYNLYPLYHYLDVPVVRVAGNIYDIQAFVDNMGNEPLLRQHGLTGVLVEDAVKGAKRLWFVRSFGNTFEWQPHADGIREWLSHHWRAVESRRFKDLELTLYISPVP